MPLPTWIRDLIGIHKDMIDARKAKLEIRKLEDEENERYRLITPATIDDVKKYDPKISEIKKKIEYRHTGGREFWIFWVWWFKTLVVLFALLMLVRGLAALIEKIEQYFAG